MADVVLSLIFVCFGIALTIVAGAVGAWLQHRYWGEQYQRQLQTNHKEEALDLTKELAGLMDRRLFRQRQFLWAVQSENNERIQEAIRDYRKAVFEWNDNFGRIKAGLWNSFDYSRSYRI